MNELYVGNANTCRGCMKMSEDLYIMNTREISLYLYYVQVDDWTGIMKMCFICKYLLHKFANFASECQKVNQMMIKGLKEDQTGHQANQKPAHNYITTNPVIQYLGPELNCIKSDDLEAPCDEYKTDDQNGDEPYDEEFDDDDVPLMMLKDVKEEGDVKVKKRKKNLHDDSYNNGKEDTLKQKGKAKVKKQLKEGFSSRMVQETNEYEVIKLTKEQVLQEMEEKLKCDKYLRSVFKCERCAKGFNFKDVIENHMKKHSKEHGKLKCDICTQYCPSAVSLRGHMKSHTTRYKCKLCSAVRISRQHLLEHHALEHTLDASDYSCLHCPFTTKYKCKLCSAVRISRQHLLEHHALEHTLDAADYSCLHCPFTTKKRTVIQRHVRSHKSGKSLICNVCGAGFSNMHTLRMHTSRHDPSQRFGCAQCGQKFAFPSLLHRHMRSHTHRDHYCVECDVTFKSIDNLKLHFKRAKKHRDPSTYKYKCSQCDERFISPSSVQAHLSASHGAAKTHACEHCGKLYSSRESAKSHERRVHADASRVRCDVCQKGFSRKYVLAKHLRTHTEAPQGSCGVYNQRPMKHIKEDIPDIDVTQIVKQET